MSFKTQTCVKDFCAWWVYFFKFTLLPSLVFPVYYFSLPPAKSFSPYFPFFFGTIFIFCLFFPVSSLENKTIKNFLNQHGSSHNITKRQKKKHNSISSDVRSLKMSRRRKKSAVKKSTSVNEWKKQMDHFASSYET